MLQRAGVQPGLDVALAVPGVRVQVEALHGGLAVDEAGDAHAVVEVVRLLGDQVDLGHRVAAAEVVDGGHARDPVADHDDVGDRLVIREARDLAQAGRRGLVGLQRDGDGALDARAAGHAGVGREAEPLERRLLVVGDAAQALHARP